MFFLAEDTNTTDEICTRVDRRTSERRDEMREKERICVRCVRDVCVRDVRRCVREEDDGLPTRNPAIPRATGVREGKGGRDVGV